MKFNVSVTLRGKQTNKIVCAPIINNPLESENLASLLAGISQNLPNNDLVETVGISVSLQPINGSLFDPKLDNILRVINLLVDGSTLPTDAENKLREAVGRPTVA